MKPSILIVRSVSMERLEGLFAALRDRWPHGTFSVLTAPGREAEVAAHSEIESVHILKSGSGIGFGGLPPGELRAAAVVVPVINARGSGYENVFQTALRIPAGAYFLGSRCTT